MSTPTPFTFYKPKHLINYNFKSVTEVHTSGQIRTDYHYDGSPNVHGDISSQSHIVGYDVTIRYDGPNNIGNNVIIATRLPNYFYDAQVIQRTKNATGLSPYKNGCVPEYSTNSMECCRCIACATTICCIGAIMGGCIEDRRADNRANFEAKRNLFTVERWNKEIAKLIRNADDIVDARISKQNSERAAMQSAVYAPAQPIQPMMPKGMVTISEAQLASLVAQAAHGLQNLASSPSASGATNAANSNSNLSPASSNRLPKRKAAAAASAMLNQYKPHTNGGASNQSIAPLAIASPPPASITASRI